MTNKQAAKRRNVAKETASVELHAHDQHEGGNLSLLTNLPLEIFEVRAKSHKIAPSIPC